MPATIAAPPRSNLPPPMRWSATEFHRAGDSGVFEGRRPFLIEGVLYERGPMNPPHATAMSLTLRTLWTVFGSGWLIRSQQPLPLGLDTDPQPDFAIVRGSARDFSKHPSWAELVVEVSDTSRDTDLTTKAELYATAKIPEYWVLDLVERKLIAMREPTPLSIGGFFYRDQREYEPGEAIAPLAAPDTPIAVADLLP